MINFYLVQKYSIRSTKSDPRVSFHLSPLSPPPQKKSAPTIQNLNRLCALIKAYLYEITSSDV